MLAIMQFISQPDFNRKLALGAPPPPQVASYLPYLKYASDITAHGPRHMHVRSQIGLQS